MIDIWGDTGVIYQICRNTAHLLGCLNNVRHLMTRYQCPACKKKTFPCWRKLAISPWWGKRCKECKTKINVDSKMSIIFLLISQVMFFVGIFVTLSLMPSPMPFYVFFWSIVLGGLLGAGIGFYFYCRMVPLVVRDA
jgi:hypothetical protein